MGIQTTLLYACEAMSIKKTKVKDLITTQGNLIKASLGLKRSCHTTPILQALDIQSVSNAVDFRALNLLRSCLLHPSGASQFYSNLLMHESGSKTQNTLVGRTLQTAHQHGINVLKFVMNSEYYMSVKRLLKGRVAFGSDGLIDSVRGLLSNYTQHDRVMLHDLIHAF